ncbi:MAG: hypothetical protein ACPGN3_06405 [Opitutales bacterium]
MKLIQLPLVLSLSILVLAGCKTLEPAKYSEFTRTTDFTTIESFYIGDVKASEHSRFNRERGVEEATVEALEAGLTDLGYSRSEMPADISVSARWRLVTALRLEEPMYSKGPGGGRVDADRRIEKRYNLVIEISDEAGVFWVYESDRRLQFYELTEERARRMTAAAIARFPTSTLFENSNP